MRPSVVLASCAVLVAASLGAAAAPSASGTAASTTTAGARSGLPALSKLKITFVRHATGFVEPTRVEAAADGSGRLFVTQRGGLIRVYLGKGKIQAKPYLDLRTEVRASGDEEGLLGLVFSPHFAKDHHFWGKRDRGL